MEQARKKKSLRAGHSSGVTGRDLFTLNPELVATDDADAVDYEREDKEADIIAAMAAGAAAMNKLAEEQALESGGAAAAIPTQTQIKVCVFRVFWYSGR